MGTTNSYRISEQKDRTYKIEYSFDQNNQYHHAVVRKPTADTLKEAIQYCASTTYHIVWYKGTSVEDIEFEQAVARRIPNAVPPTLLIFLRRLWNEGITFGRKNQCCSSRGCGCDD